jgi:hypothetical protein
MPFDFSSIFFILIAMMALQPLLMGRWYAMRRALAIRAIEKEHGTREKRSLFGFAVSRHIDLEDAQTVIAAIKETPDDIPIDLIIHTPGGLVLTRSSENVFRQHRPKADVSQPATGSRALRRSWMRSASATRD